MYNKLLGFHPAGENCGGWWGLNGQAVSYERGLMFKVVNRSQRAKLSTKDVSTLASSYCTSRWSWDCSLLNDQTGHGQSSSQLCLGNALGFSPDWWRAGSWPVMKTGHGNDLQRSKRHEATGPVVQWSQTGKSKKVWRQLLWHSPSRKLVNLLRFSEPLNSLVMLKSKGTDTREIRPHLASS